MRFKEVKGWVGGMGFYRRSLAPFPLKSNSNGSCQKWGAKCHFATLNSVLSPLNSVFAPMVGAKLGCHFNNLMFFIKKYN